MHIAKLLVWGPKLLYGMPEDLLLVSWLTLQSYAYFPVGKLTELNWAYFRVDQLRIGLLHKEQH